MVAHTFNSTTQEVDAGGSLRSKPALSTWGRELFGTSRTTWRDPISKNNNNNNNNKINPSFPKLLLLLVDIVVTTATESQFVVLATLELTM